MHLINARNVQQALPVGLALLYEHGALEPTRAGDVLRFPGPVTTVLEVPTERVLFHPWRDANPFFHIVEAVWMLAGRNTLADLTPYVKRMADFSDDGGVTQPGAYGKRWRSWHRSGWPDQLDWAVKRLRANPNDRRVVIQMWDPAYDPETADENGADVPCNISMLPWVMGGKLHLTIFNRSNDIIWGLYGANAVHFSVCLEYLASRVGLGVGTMATVSNNFHAYVDKMPDQATVKKSLHAHDPYDCGDVEPEEMFFHWSSMDSTDEEREQVIRGDLTTFFDHGAAEVLRVGRWPWLRWVLAPLALAHKRHRGPSEGRYEATQRELASVQASDWRLAATEWVERRHGR